MAASLSARTLAEIVDTIGAKQHLYRTAFATDLDRLKRRHGEAVIAEALRLVERNARVDVDAWDRRGHAVTVSRAVDRLLIRRAEDPDSFFDDVKV
jgi:hypothetical protein